MKNGILASLAVLTLGLSAVPAKADLITNGSFEFGTNQPGAGGFATIPSLSNSSITGWTVTGSVDYINGYWQAQNGTYSVDLNGDALGGVQQSVATQVGQSYLVTFWLSANPDHLDSHPDSRTLNLSWGPGQTHAFTYNFDTPPGGTNSKSNMNWTEYSWIFTATSTSTLLSFNSAAPQNCCYGPALDSVSMTAVPEASTWAMMIVGFFGVGFLAFRKKSNAALRIA